MSFTVNINQFRVTHMTNNASIIIGPGFHNSHASTTKHQGQISTSGDGANASSLMKNLSIDPDFNDQAEYGNSDNAGANQGEIY